MDAVTVVLIVVPVLLVLVLWIGVTYNRLVRLRNQVEEAWAGIDVQLQRRADLVPNLVETVKGYQIHEDEVLRGVTEARSRVLDAQGPREAGQADDMLASALGRLFAVAEDYPELRASTNFLQLQEALVGIEEEVSFARRYYNGAVEDLNTRIQSLPDVLVARPLGFSEAEYFKVQPGDREAPVVDFGDRG